jgi:hypothetical protein
VPNIFLEYASTLAGKTIEFYSAFISYLQRQRRVPYQPGPPAQDQGRDEMKS